MVLLDKAYCEMMGWSPEGIPTPQGLAELEKSNGQSRPSGNDVKERSYLLKAAVLVKPGEITLVERPACHPEPGELAVSVNYVGICGSDQARF